MFFEIFTKFEPLLGIAAHLGSHSRVASGSDHGYPTASLQEITSLSKQKCSKNGLINNWFASYQY